MKGAVKMDFGEANKTYYHNSKIKKCLDLL